MAETTSESMPPWKTIAECFDSDDEGMPPRESRNGKWWFATYHNVTAIVGSGILGLPTTMAYLGWEAGIVVLVMSWGITLCTLWQMVQMYELPGEERSSRTYYELGQKAFGERLGLWIVLPLQLTMFVGTGIVYTVTAKQSLWLFYQLLSCKHDVPFDPVLLATGDQCCGHFGQWPFLVGYWLLQLLLAQLDGFNSIASISLAASLMSICYCVIAAVQSWKQGVTNHSLNISTNQTLLANCSTSYHLPDKSTADQVYAMPAFDIIEKCFVDNYSLQYLIEDILVKFHCPTPGKQTSTKVMRIITRSIYVSFTTLVAIVIPSFQDLLAFFGGLASTPTTYFLPCIIWLRLKKPKAFTIEWFLNWGFIVIGTLLMLVGTLGGLRNLIIHGLQLKYDILFSCNKPTLPSKCPDGKVYFN